MVVKGMLGQRDGLLVMWLHSERKIKTCIFKWDQEASKMYGVRLQLMWK